jgi:hypothetical protein
MSERFADEKRVYEARRDQLLREQNEGKFAVIKGETFIGVAHSFPEAIETGILRTKGREFFVQRIQPAGTIEWMSHIERPA